MAIRLIALDLDGTLLTSEKTISPGDRAAVEEAMYLTKFASKVTLIHRRSELRAVRSIQEKAFANKKTEFLWDSVVEEVRQKVERLALPKSKSVKTVLVYDGELDPSVEENDFFDYLIPAEKLILFTDDKKI